MEQIDLFTYYSQLILELEGEQVGSEHGAFLEQIFTNHALSLLSESGETENYHVAFNECITPRNKHKVNGYAISDNYETIDLFVTRFVHSDQVQKISKSEIEGAAKLAVSFFKKAQSPDFAHELEETSDIFDFARTIGESEHLRKKLVRLNVTILTNGIFRGVLPEERELFEWPVFFKIVDINYLFNITEKEHTPIAIDFQEGGFKVPCIKANINNPEYQSYLAIIPAAALAAIYEKYGARLLEQNVRAFLQFTGKVNKGIRSTIINEPHMFLAFNNGIAATANRVGLKSSSDGLLIETIDDLQIVNGGQTTAAIYHTAMKDHADLSNVYIQMKISVIGNEEKFSRTVSRIAEYANTQNKVSISDLSSNTPFHIEIEKLSRSIWAPPARGQVLQTKWFYERARGQYKNARPKYGSPKRKIQEFDQINPKSQLFTKEELAKYMNVCQEIYHGSKLTSGPHMVVRGSQKSYSQFIAYNLFGFPNSLFFEELIGKAILFRNTEAIYGTKPNSIGDMRYITVPYAIAWLCHKTNGRLDFKKIWKAQNISESLRRLLYALMQQIEMFIKQNAPGALFGEWAKKEDCWVIVRDNRFNIDLQEIKMDILSLAEKKSREREMEAEGLEERRKFEQQSLIAISSGQWEAVSRWGGDSGLLNNRQQSVSLVIAKSMLNGDAELSESLLKAGLKIMEIVKKHEPDLLD